MAEFIEITPEIKEALARMPKYDAPPAPVASKPAVPVIESSEPLTQSAPVVVEARKDPLANVQMVSIADIQAQMTKMGSKFAGGGEAPKAASPAPNKPAAPRQTQPFKLGK